MQSKTNKKRIVLIIFAVILALFVILVGLMYGAGVFDVPNFELGREEVVRTIEGYPVKLNTFKATHRYFGDLTKDVKIEGDVNFNVPGEYVIKYSVETILERKTEFESKIVVSPKNTKGIPVLMYHWFYDDEANESIEGKNNQHNYLAKTDFEAQIKYLVDNNFYFVNWQELSDYVDNKIDLPEKSIVLTDDDGVISFFKIAVPILQKYNVPMTAFIITDKATWKDYKNIDVLDYESHSNLLHVRDKKVKNKGTGLTKTLAELKEDLGVSIEMLGGNHAAFAYPFGDYNDKFVQALDECGFTFAFTIKNGRVLRDSDKLLEPRVRISRTTTLEQFINLVS